MALMTQVGVEFIARNRAAGTINQFQVSMHNLGGTLLRFAGIGGGIYAIQRGFASMIRSASDAQETLNKFNVVFRSQAAEAAQWAEQFGDQVGRSTQDVEKWMAGLQDLFVPLGFARDKAFELSKALTQLAVDVASFNNQADADVIRDFQSALVGNHEAVRKYGIIITEASLKQEALNKGYNKSYQELTNLEKVTLRMGIIQASTTDAQGDALRTADSYANQIKRLSANWTELKTELGGPVMGVLADIIGATNRAVEATKNWNKIIVEAYEKKGQLPPAYGAGIGVWGFTAKEMAEISARAQGLPTPTTLEIPEDRLRYMEDMARRAAELQRQMAQTPVGPDGATAMTAEQMKLMEKQARDYMESVRHMDYLTRMERIENLEAYRRAHADIMYDIVGQETEANQLIQREIEALLRSRLDAMRVYHKELREDFESLNLYISERFASTARSIENSMSDAFYSMIAEGNSFRDAMSNFLREIGNAFARMAAEMMARWLMLKTMDLGSFLGLGRLFGGGGGAIGAGGSLSPFGGFGAAEAHGGGLLGQDTFPIRYVSPKLFENAPRYHDLEPGEVAVIAQRGEEISRPGRARVGPPPNVIINNNTGQPFTTDGSPTFDGQRWVVGIVAQNIKQGGALQKMMRR